MIEKNTLLTYLNELNGKYTNEENKDPLPGTLEMLAELRKKLEDGVFDDIVPGAVELPDLWKLTDSLPDLSNAFILTVKRDEQNRTNTLLVRTKSGELWAIWGVTVPMRHGQPFLEFEGGVSYIVGNRAVVGKSSSATMTLSGDNKIAITIVDDQGVVQFDRELTAEEWIPHYEAVHNTFLHAGVKIIVAPDAPVAAPLVEAIRKAGHIIELVKIDDTNPTR